MHATQLCPQIASWALVELKAHVLALLCCCPLPSHVMAALGLLYPSALPNRGARRDSCDIGHMGSQATKVGSFARHTLGKGVEMKDAERMRLYGAGCFRRAMGALAGRGPGRSGPVKTG